MVGTLAPPQLPDGPGEDEVRVAEQARISGFREESRRARMRIADEAQPAFRRAVSWGAECGSSRVLFTTAGVPVMTRLRMDDRQALDTLIDAGVARSRSEALAWCVRLVAQHEAEWISELRDAMSAVEEVRNKGPKSGGTASSTSRLGGGDSSGQTVRRSVYSLRRDVRCRLRARSLRGQDPRRRARSPKSLVRGVREMTA